MINEGSNWWISGGNPDTSESYIYDGTSFTPFVNMLTNDWAHHLIAVNETHVVKLEGANQSSYWFDLTTNTWSNFPALPSVSNVWPI